MPDDYEITITPSGISVRTVRVRRVRDEATGEELDLPDAPHRAAVGVADFAGDETKYAQRVAELVEPHLGKGAAGLVGRVASAESMRDAVAAERDALISARAAATLAPVEAAEGRPADG